MCTLQTWLVALQDKNATMKFEDNLDNGHLVLAYPGRESLRPVHYCNAFQPFPSFPCLLGKIGKENNPQKTRIFYPYQSREKKGKTLKKTRKSLQGQKARNSPITKERKDREGRNSTTRNARGGHLQSQSQKSRDFGALSSRHFPNFSESQGRGRLLSDSVILAHPSKGPGEKWAPRNHPENFVSESGRFRLQISL